MEQTTKITKIKSHKAGARTNMNKLQFAAWRKCKQCKSEKREKHKHLRSPSGFGSGLSAPTSHTVNRMAMAGTNTVIITVITESQEVWCIKLSVANSLSLTNQFGVLT